MKIYINAKSKKEINDKLSDGLKVFGENFSMFGGGGFYKLDSNLPSGTVVSVYDKIINGSPYAKSYGTWNGKKVI